MASANEPELSIPAVACMRERLPGLLAVVRARRRRRQAARAAVLAVAACVATGLLWWPSRVRAPATAPGATPPTWTMLADDPTVVARSEVHVAVRAEWFLADDGQLQALLAADARDAGLVRIGGQVLVSQDAVDPFPRP